MSAPPSPGLPHAGARALVSADLPGLLAVQQACYGVGFVESADVFARRLSSPANCSQVMEHGGQVCAYLAAYRSLLGKVTPLHGDFEPVDEPDTLYLHDMAVLPQHTGQGLAGALLQPMWQRAAAHGLRYTALVSVQGTATYWQRHGYAAHTLIDTVQRARLATYGEGAVYMVRGLAR